MIHKIFSSQVGPYAFKNQYTIDENIKGMAAAQI